MRHWGLIVECSCKEATVTPGRWQSQVISRAGDSLGYIPHSLNHYSVRGRGVRRPRGEGDQKEPFWRQSGNGGMVLRGRKGDMHLIYIFGR